MQERDQFGKIFMPFVYLICIVGVLIMGWQGIEKMEVGRWDKDILVLGEMLFLMPIPFWFFRLVRGHYSSKLKD